MTDPVVSSYPGYATPAFRAEPSPAGVLWLVTAQPWDEYVGLVQEHSAGWTAHPKPHRMVGLFPDKQAAGEALVKHAGYEVL